MKRILLFSIMLLSILPLFSQTTYLVGSTELHPGIDFDFLNIASAIDVSVDGDTIVVYPGRYSGLQVNYSGKNIYITSLFLYSEDRNDIYNTIIDRYNELGSAVIFMNNETRDAVLNGFTIEHGIGERLHLPNYPQWREGGGIIISNANPTILNCIIQDNFASSQGGGIYIQSSGLPTSPFLAGNVIKNNVSNGLYGGLGGGLTMVGNVQVVFDTINKNSIFLNSAPECKDIYSGSSQYMSVVLDTFTVATDDPYYISMLAGYYFSCDNWIIDQADNDLYVSVSGNDTNTGFTPDAPLKTIKEAMFRIKSNPDNRNTIFIAPGVYKATEGQIFPIKIKSDVILQGSGQDVTIFDLEQNTGAIHSDAGAKRFKISRIAFINNWADFGMLGRMAPILLNGTDFCEISDCHFENNLMGIQTNEINGERSRTEPVSLRNLSFINNFNNVLELHLENAAFENVKILYNHSIDLGFPSFFTGTPITIYTHGDTRATYSMSNILLAEISDPIVMKVGDNIDVLLNNATIVKEMSHELKEYIYYIVLTIGRYSDVRTFNSIFYNNNGYIGGYETSTFHIDHSLLLGGPGMVLCNLVWGDGNIDTYPGFDWGYLGVLDWPYQLMATSPCIDAGTVNIPDYTWFSEDLLGNTRIIGDTVDMGAYEFNGNSSHYVDFEGFPRIGEAPLTVQFTDTSVGYEITTWQWDFNNDGIFDSTEQNPSFTYYTTGYHTVRLVINNGQASRVKPEYINPRPEVITGGSLQGLVTYNGNPLNDVLVSIIGTTLNATTNEWGMYTIPNVAAGVYSVRASLAGYETFTHDGVVINIDEVTIRHFVLSPLSDSDDVSVAVATVLWGNYPNPFNPSTVIAFDMGSAGEVVIDVYNIKGAKVKTLVNGVFGAGRHSVVWDGCADDGRAVGSGVYFYRMGAGGYSAVRKMLLVK